MKLALLVIGLFLVADEGAAQNPRRNTRYSLNDVEKFRRKLSRFMDDTKYVTNLESGYIENVRQELKKYPLLSVINEKLVEVKNKFDEAGVCKTLINTKLEDFGISLKNSIVLPLSQTKTIIDNDVSTIINQLHNIDSDLASEEGVSRVQDELHSIFKSFEEASGKYSKKRAEIRDVLGKTLTGDKILSFKQLVLTPAINCVTENFPFDWLMLNFFGLWNSTLS